jgi:hypothetical protein
VLKLAKSKKQNSAGQRPPTLRHGTISARVFCSGRATYQARLRPWACSSGGRRPSWKASRSRRCAERGASPIRRSATRGLCAACAPARSYLQLSVCVCVWLQLVRGARCEQLWARRCSCAGRWWPVDDGGGASGAGAQPLKQCADAASLTALCGRAAVVRNRAVLQRKRVYTHTIRTVAMAEHHIRIMFPTYPRSQRFGSVEACVKRRASWVRK